LFKAGRRPGLGETLVSCQHPTEILKLQQRGDTVQQILISSHEQRLRQISLARQAVIDEGQPAEPLLSAAWIERSWRRCLARGQRPQQPIVFDTIAAQTLRRTQDEHHALVSAAREVLEQLGRAIANTRYFAVLTSAQGVVIDVAGRIDRSDRRADLITRIGTDLSEQSVGTTAISAALTELQPVWLHRGEHFFGATSVYSCAGAPLFDPDGRCTGMLDLTGIEAQERPELTHLAAQSALRIENALLLARSHNLLLRLNWPGHPLGFDGDGLIALDADGCVVGANQTARRLVPQLAPPHPATPHVGDLFGFAYQRLFDAARQHAGPFEVPLWSGLRLNALTLPGSDAATAAAPTGRVETDRPLREVEDALIRRAVDAARGNVAQAARALGISRATVYRKLQQQNRPEPR
jgi:transcriptional regulator of acetoin/glycerol metabolism